MDLSTHIALEGAEPCWQSKRQCWQLTKLGALVNWINLYYKTSDVVRADEYCVAIVRTNN
jgi:hypothetical protein